MSSALFHGHAGGHLRDAFGQYVDTGIPSGDATHDGEPMTARRLTGLLWNCTDVLPNHWCVELDLRPGSTYAQAARVVRMRL